jgi:recombination protein RecT
MTKAETPMKSPKGKNVVLWETFESELKSREQSIVAMLPGHISRERFINSAIAAVKQTPDLLACMPRSLFSAITKSAQDGLLPDGREGVITIYNEKQKDNTWAKIAQWNPMAWGLRKRARELDDIIVSTSVVHKNDAFTYQEGDDPRIEHKPASLGTGRGEMIGVYAIFRKGANILDILHREVMDADQVQQVRAQSKQPDGIMWTKFTPEAWRKTVLRRGFKSVPCSEKLDSIVRRDDDLFDFTEAPAGVSKPKATVVQPAPAGERKALPPVVGEPVEAPSVVEAADAETELVDA